MRVLFPAAEVLPEDFLEPPDDLFFVTRIEDVFEVKQRSHQLDQQGGPASSACCDSSGLQARAKEIVATTALPWRFVGAKAGLNIDLICVHGVRLAKTASGRRSSIFWSSLARKRASTAICNAPFPRFQSGLIYFLKDGDG